ncbi:hypothetical protein [Pseudofrankia sp. DC12]|uniref:hypothetical protein n=1 Tax=Pseudofrankia sp. DC12 TaxID=683315 RepID=UPI0005F7DF51|nr:hypothetical protein [Pseudofrankia sp. DC12]
MTVDRPSTVEVDPARPAQTGQPRRPAGQLRQARRTCAAGCFGYHAAWPACRRLGIKSHPGWHRDFLTAALTSHPAAATRPLDIVLAGAADDRMLTTLAQVPLDYPPRFHLIDRCPTPLARNAAIASRLGLHLTTDQRDLPGPPGEKRFDAPLGLPAASADLVVTDGLLSLLASRAAVTGVLAEVTGLLRPGGRFCYTTRLTARPGQRLEYDRTGRLLQAAITLSFLPAPPAGRWDAARRTWSRPARTAAFRSADDLFDALAAAGLTMTDVHVRRPPSVLLAAHPRRLSAGSKIVRLRGDVLPDRR